MSDLRELYQEVILDHYKKPRNFGALEAANCSAEGYNPLCGDKVRLELRLDGEVIEEIAFEGVGCAISTASASLMTEAVSGSTREQAEQLAEHFHRLLTEEEGSGDGQADLGKLEVLGGVREFPIRIKCATLAWHALRAALKQSSDEPAVVTTE